MRTGAQKKKEPTRIGDDPVFNALVDFSVALVFSPELQDDAPVVTVCYDVLEMSVCSVLQYRS